VRSRHLLGIADLEPDEIALVLDTAEAMTEIAARPIKKVPTCAAARRQPVLRAEHEDPDVVRGGGRSAVSADT
jgi:aspartate carbamoyltransferase catalytic subunit